MGVSLNTGIRQRERDRRVAHNEREAAERRHNGLCIRQTASYGMEYCWCTCLLCWDKVGRRCVCSPCPCHADETQLPLFPTIPGILARGRTLYLTEGPTEGALWQGTKKSTVTGKYTRSS